MSESTDHISYSEMQREHSKESYISSMHKSNMMYGLEWLFRWYPRLCGISWEIVQNLGYYQRISLVRYLESLTDTLSFSGEAWSTILSMIEDVSDEKWVAGCSDGSTQEFGKLFTNMYGEPVKTYILLPTLDSDPPPVAEIGKFSGSLGTIGDVFRAAVKSA